MSLRRTVAVARKEFLHIQRDPRSLAMALAIPLVLLLLFGYALTLDVDRIATLVYDQDGSPQSRDLISRLEGSRFFQVEGRVDNYSVIQQAVDRSQIVIGVIIPTDFSRKLLAGQEVDVQVLVEGSDSNTASIALGYVQSVFAAYSLQLRAAEQVRLTGRQIKPPAEARLRVLYNSELESKNYIVPGLIAVILMIIGSLLTSLTIAREWELGTMEQVLSTPLRPAELAIGKMLAYFAIGVVDVIICVVVGLTVFDVPFRGSVLILAAGCGVFLIGALFWGIMLSAMLRSQLLAYQASLVSSFLPAYLLSGFVFAIEAMPRSIQAVTHLVPARYFISILKGTFLKGVGLEILIWQFVFLSVYSLIVFGVATKQLRQKVA
jgi:drug efflux transport system permease protein